MISKLKSLRQVFEDYSELMILLKEAVKLCSKKRYITRSYLLWETDYFYELQAYKKLSVVYAGIIRTKSSSEVIWFLHDKNYNLTQVMIEYGCVTYGNMEKLSQSFGVLYCPLYEEDYETFEKLFSIIKKALKIK